MKPLKATTFLACLFLAIGCTQKPDSQAIRADARKVLIESLASQDPELRLVTIEVAPQVLDATDCLPALRQTLSHPSPSLRVAALVAIADIKTTGTDMALLVRPRLDDPDPGVRLAAACALYRMGDKAQFDVVRKGADSPETRVRRLSAFLLPRTHDRRAIRPLRTLMRDRDSAVRLQAMESLWRMGDTEALAPLVAVALRPKPEEQLIAILALSGPRDTRVIPHIQEAMDDDYVAVRLAAARSLGLLGDAKGYPTAVKYLRSRELHERTLAAFALGAIGKMEAMAPLKPMLAADQPPVVRVVAAYAILSLRDPTPASKPSVTGGHY